jgi:hypothetical protein
MDLIHYIGTSEIECMMVKELDTVALTHDISEYGLERGDVGAVVHCYKDGFAFEVEFVTADEKTNRDGSI